MMKRPRSRSAATTSRRQYVILVISSTAVLVFTGISIFGSLSMTLPLSQQQQQPEEQPPPPPPPPPPPNDNDYLALLVSNNLRTIANDKNNIITHKDDYSKTNSSTLVTIRETINASISNESRVHGKEGPKSNSNSQVMNDTCIHATTVSIKLDNNSSSNYDKNNKVLSIPQEELSSLSSSSLSSNQETTKAQGETETNSTGDTTTTTATNRTTGQTEPLGKHPRAGARYPDGTYGYVADVTAIRRYYVKLYHQHYKHRRQKLLQDPVTGCTSSTRSTNCSSSSSSLLVLSWRSDIDPLYTFLTYNRNDIVVWQKKSTGKNEFDYICNTPAGRGFESRRGYSLMMNRIQVNAPNPPKIALPSNTTRFTVDTKPLPPKQPPQAQEQQANNNHNKRKSRILCVVYTYHKGKYRLDGITSTWGWRCDGFFAASTMTQMDDPHAPGFGMVDLPHRGEEKYGNMWQKTRSIMGYLYDNYLTRFEYFYLVGDDTHLIVENLRNYLETVELEWNITNGIYSNHSTMTGYENNSLSHLRTHDNHPLYLGHPWPGGPQYYFAGGGGGYVINRAVLQRYIEQAQECYSTVEVSSEDRYISYCLRSLKIRLTDGFDPQQRSRFHGLDPAWLSAHNSKNIYFKSMEKYQKQYNLSQHRGQDYVSTQTVSMHLFKTSAIMKRIHAILYRACPLGTILGDEQYKSDQEQQPFITSLEELRRLEKEEKQANHHRHHQLQGESP